MNDPTHLGKDARVPAAAASGPSAAPSPMLHGTSRGTAGRAMADLAGTAATVGAADLVRLSCADPAGIWWAGALACRSLPGSPALATLLDHGELPPVTDLRGDARFADLAGHYATLAQVPVVGRDRVLGALSAFYAPGIRVGADRLRTLAAMARLAGTTAERHAAERAATRRRAEERRLAAAVAAGEAERGRLVARELHEGLANQLAGTALLVQSLARRVATLGPDLQPELLHVSRQLHAALGATRELATGSLPYVLAAHGLVDALKITLRRLERQPGGRIALIAHPLAGTGLSPSRALCLLEIAVQLVGIARPAQGTGRLTVRLRRDGRTGTRLSVSGEDIWFGATPVAGTLPLWRTVRYHARRAGADVRPFDGAHPQHHRRVDVVLAEPAPVAADR